MIIKYLKTSIIYILIIGVVIYSYIIAKAYGSSFTHDESFSYLNYVHTSFMDIISFSDWYTNNHILNSLLMKYSEIAFGNSEVSLRLPNLLAFLVYMAYSYFLIRKTNPLLQVSLFILLCTNNSIIDLFGLARGYGLSFGFMLMTLYHFIQSFYENKTKHIILFHLGALLSVLSSFMLFDFYISLIAIYIFLNYINCKYIAQKKYNFYLENKSHIIPILINVAILFEPIRRISMNSNLDFGGKIGFYNNTVKDIIVYSLHQANFSKVQLIICQILFTSLVLIPFVFIIKMLIKKNVEFFNKNLGLIITNMLLIFMSLAIILQHLLFKADYPIDRFTLFILPIFILFFVFLLHYLFEYYKKTIATIALTLSLISCISFFSKIDMYSCSEWGYDMETKNMIQILSENQIKDSKLNKKIKLGINWQFEPTINFYIQTKKLDWLLPVDRNGLSSSDDYIYIFKYDIQQLSSLNYSIIHAFQRTNTLLIKINPR